FLIVEHNMSFVMNLCSEVIVLQRGREIASGKPEAVRSDPAVLDAYLGA
ncbi:MAG: branched-chain amino acid transport system ATP-binding protein, partial [Chloroflexota bacterium]|nr:branched-chain amino acid transport system ATP-binding protein [Chloroflexota bacterium]